MADHLTTLEQAIGQQMRRLREATRVRQETVAAAATMWGLSWTQATVAAIELGPRGLSLGEFMMLPLIFDEAGIRKATGRHLELEDFIPRDTQITPPTGAVSLTGAAPSLQMPLRIVRTLLRGGLPPASVRANRAEAGPGEAERKAARKLGCSPEVIMAAARDLWGRTLSEERDQRIGARAATLDRRSLQAVRGRVTRALVRGLGPTITQLQRRRRK